MVASSGGNQFQAGTQINPTIQTVLDSFQNVFAKPTGLPPPRSHDHQFQLKSESKPPVSSHTVLLLLEEGN